MNLTHVAEAGRFYVLTYVTWQRTTGYNTIYHHYLYDNTRIIIISGDIYIVYCCIKFFM